MSGKVNMQYDYAQELAESVNHPAHYGGGDNPYEAIKIMETWYGYAFHLPTAIKYILLHDEKGDGEENIEKAIWYLSRYIKMRKEVERGKRNTQRANPNR